jgi:hypothetical protein
VERCQRGVVGAHGRRRLSARRMRYPLERFRPLLALSLRPRLTGGLLRPRAIANSAGIPFGFSSRWGRHTIWF